MKNKTRILAAFVCASMLLGATACNETSSIIPTTTTKNIIIVDNVDFFNQTYETTETDIDEDELPEPATETLVTPEEVLAKYEGARLIELEDDRAEIDGVVIESFDYEWHVDPFTVHDEVKNAPAEFYTGDKPETDAAVYIDHELYYYPLLDAYEFELVNYCGEMEWAYYYQDGVNDEYIFATLPSFMMMPGFNQINDDLDAMPVYMMHSEEDAEMNQVLHIKEAGTYVLTGHWMGQINIDLGEDSIGNSDAVVTLVFAGADIECTVAPGVIFNNVYEADGEWSEREEADVNVVVTGTGARVIIADDTVNSVSGKNVFRMLKTAYKESDSTDEIKVQKKCRKTDAAFYSFMSMTIEGEEVGNGVLTVSSGFEGIDTELHLAIKSGYIVINSLDDGMNVNKDDVSVLAIEGGSVTINAALGSEGDGIDSNGFVRIDGGVLNVNGIRVPDNAVDSYSGVYYNAGTVNIDGLSQDLEPGSVQGAIGNVGPEGFVGRPDEHDANKAEEEFAGPFTVEPEM